MNIALLLLVLIGIYNISFSKTDDYLSKSQTTEINGIFVGLIFLGHFSQYIEYGKWDFIFSTVHNKMGQLIVVPFLFYSGYGIMTSIMKRGIDYINKIPVNRILTVWCHFAGAIILFYITGFLLGSRYSFTLVLKALTGWQSIGNSNWYIFCVLCLYVFVYISFKLFKNNDAAALVLMIILCCSYIFLLKGKKDQWWYDTILVYPFGMVYAKYQDMIERYILKNNVMYIISVIMTTYLGYITFHNRSSFIYFEGLCICFCVSILLITYKVHIGNSICGFLGKYTFEIYILQRIPMMLLQHIVKEKYVYLFLSFVFTLLLAVMFKSIFDKIDNKIKAIFVY